MIMMCFVMYDSKCGVLLVTKGCMMKKVKVNKSVGW